MQTLNALFQETQAFMMLKNEVTELSVKTDPHALKIHLK